MNFLKLIPSKLVSEEFKILYKSGWLTGAFRTNNLELMALTRLEKAIIKWAIREEIMKKDREEVKNWMLRYAIGANKDEVALDYYRTKSTYQKGNKDA